MNDAAYGSGLREARLGAADGSTLAGLPLCVDLDGTLLCIDTLVEGAFALAASPGFWLAVPGLLLDGRAALKRYVATNARLDVGSLPYNTPLLEFLKQQKATGRTIVLVTAADQSVAQAVSDHLQLFDAVIASNGINNMKGEAKARALVARFGVKGFAYAGNDRSDLAVWRQAGAAVVVDAPASVARLVPGLAPVEASFSREQPRLIALAKAMRPYQWVKNLLVFVPIFTAHAIGDRMGLIRAGLMFAAFCATASAIYLINDAADLRPDRRHLRKRHRPFASGALPLLYGLSAAVLLLAIGLTLGSLAGGATFAIGYAAISLSYSIKLKEKPLVDVFMLAALYLVRVVAGGEVAGHQVSLWLLGFSSFLFLSLAFLKRVGELNSTNLPAWDKLARRGYMRADQAILQLFGCASAFASSLMLALFVQNEATAERYHSPVLLWAIVPLLLFWQCRLWLSTSRGYMHDDPIVYAAKDWVSWLIGLAVAGTMIGAQLSWS
jgi:4-hydroxybenzoate polyprenyltransferase